MFLVYQQKQRLFETDAAFPNNGRQSSIQVSNPTILPAWRLPYSSTLERKK